MPSNSSPQNVQLAVFSAISAYISWGGLGLYYKSLEQVGAIEILSHRIVWSVLLLALIISFKKKWFEVAAILFAPKRLAVFALSALLISINWGLYIYAIVSKQALEGSMGYFIMPLVAVAIGSLFFAEKFSRQQVVSILLALIGVSYQIWSYGQVPWIALTLAFSFGFYGMLRKKAPANSIVGLFLETLLISPIALGFMGYWMSQGTFYFSQADIDMMFMLILAGPLTAVPLILFAFGARNLRYSTVGLLQYINPTCQFCLAIFVFKENFEMENFITFGFIWAGLILYSHNIYMQSRQKKAA